MDEGRLDVHVWKLSAVSGGLSGDQRRNETVPLVPRSPSANVFLPSRLQNHIKSLRAAGGAAALIKPEFTKLVFQQQREMEARWDDGRRDGADNEVSIGKLHPRSSCLGPAQTDAFDQTRLS